MTAPTPTPTPSFFSPSFSFWGLALNLNVDDLNQETRPLATPALLSCCSIWLATRKDPRDSGCVCPLFLRVLSAYRAYPHRCQTLIQWKSTHRARADPQPGQIYDQGRSSTTADLRSGQILNQGRSTIRADLQRRQDLTKG